MVNVHVVGGNKDLAIDLKGLTMRLRILQNLIDILRASGYPGYDNRGVNSPARVARSIDGYEQTYGHASFTPAAVREAVNGHLPQKQSILQEKVATPPEAPKDIAKWDMTLLPET